MMTDPSSDAVSIQSRIDPLYDAVPIQNRKVLVVEDDVDSRTAMAHLFSDQGIEVHVAGNGQEALDLLHRQQVDLIVLDLWLPVMDGWQFRAAQRADPALCAVPVIALSADRSSKTQSIQADCYLQKPIEPAQLVFAIERVLLDQERHQLAEKLRQTERFTVLGTIAASIGHEVNNPLTYVLGNVHLLEDRVSAARRQSFSLVDREFLEDIAQMLGEVRMGAERIHAVMSTLQPLTLRREDNMCPVDLRVVMEASIAIVWNQIRHRARVIREFQGVPLIVADKARLGQVFVNLLANAAQAIPPGKHDTNEIKVTIRKRGEEVVAEIRDSGAGIPPELQKRVFQPFFTTKSRDEGTGIGLTLSRSIVEEHGGRIELLSAPGEGSTFRVVLPISPSAGAYPAEQYRDITPSNALHGRILVIDDDPLILQSVRRMLERHNDVTTTTSGPDALARLAAGAVYDAIVCDVMMPEMTGMQFYAEMERRYPHLASRVIFMSGGMLMPEVRAFQKMTRNTWLDKPFRPQAVQKAVADVIAIV